MAKSTFRLGDDGTMDTVLFCIVCGAELRYNWDGNFDPDVVVKQDTDGFWRIYDCGKQIIPRKYATEQGAEDARDSHMRDLWIADIIEEAAQEHECAFDDGSEDRPHEV